MLDAILDQLRIKLLGNVAAVRKESKKAPERLKRLMQRHVRLLAENHVIPQIVFSDSFYAVIRNVTGGRFDVNRYVDKAWPIFKRGISA